MQTSYAESHSHVLSYSRGSSLFGFQPGGFASLNAQPTSTRRSPPTPSCTRVSTVSQNSPCSQESLTRCSSLLPGLNYIEPWRAVLAINHPASQEWPCHLMQCFLQWRLHPAPRSRQRRAAARSQVSRNHPADRRGMGAEPVKRLPSENVVPKMQRGPKSVSEERA